MSSLLFIWQLSMVMLTKPRSLLRTSAKMTSISQALEMWLLFMLLQCRLDKVDVITIHQCVHREIYKWPPYSSMLEHLYPGVIWWTSLLCTMLSGLVAINWFRWPISFVDWPITAQYLVPAQLWCWCWVCLMCWRHSSAPGSVEGSPAYLQHDHGEWWRCECYWWRTPLSRPCCCSHGSHCNTIIPHPGTHDTDDQQLQKSTQTCFNP